MNNLKNTAFNVRMCFRNAIVNNFCTEIDTSSTTNKQEIPTKYVKGKHTRNLNNYFKSSGHLESVKEFIPKKYLKSRKSSAVENLYLIDSEVAKFAVKLILPYIDNMLVCETSAGLGLITKELLDKNINLVRIYEVCPEFRLGLKHFNHVYPGRVELFVKDLFQISKVSYMDRLDHGNRVKQMTKGVVRRAWTHDPVMTVIGCLPKMTFICYLLRMVTQQREIIANGRIQLFCFMRPADYIKLTAGPHLNLHTYQLWTVLFSLFFEINLLKKVPRECFLPWEHKETILSTTRYFKKIDLEFLYFVRINFKKKLPVEIHNLLPLYYFVKQFFGRGTHKIVPSIEKLIPGLGAKFITTKEENFPHIGIYTSLGTLTPDQILVLFKEMVNYKEYNSSSFAALIESELLKNDTIETDQDMINYNPDIIHDLEDKMDE